MTLHVRPTPSSRPRTPCIDSPRAAALPSPLRPRDAALVARTAATLFLGEGSIDVSLAVDGGGRLRSVFADIRRAYRFGQVHCNASPDPAAAHAALELRMGIEVLIRLSECLGALFGVRGDGRADGRSEGRDDAAARHAALMECAAAIADEALVCRDEKAVRSDAPPVQRCLTISRGADGEVHLHKYSCWRALPDQDDRAQPDGASPAPDTGKRDGPLEGPPAPAAEMRAALAFRIQPWRGSRRAHSGDPRRVLLRCRIRPVHVGDARRMHEAVPIPGPGVCDKLAAGDWRGALLALLIRLFRPKMLLRRGEVAGRAELKVYPKPRDGRAPVVVRVGPGWPRRDAHRPAVHGIEAVRQGLCAARRVGAPAPEPAQAPDDDEIVRCY